MEVVEGDKVEITVTKKDPDLPSDLLQFNIEACYEPKGK